MAGRGEARALERGGERGGGHERARPGAARRGGRAQAQHAPLPRALRAIAFSAAFRPARRGHAARDAHGHDRARACAAATQWLQRDRLHRGGGHERVRRRAARPRQPEAAPCGAARSTPAARPRARLGISRARLGSVGRGKGESRPDSLSHCRSSRAGRSHAKHPGAHPAGASALALTHPSSAAAGAGSEAGPSNRSCPEAGRSLKKTSSASACRMAPPPSSGSGCASTVDGARPAASRGGPGACSPPRGGSGDSIQSPGPPRDAASIGGSERCDSIIQSLASCSIGGSEHCPAPAPARAPPPSKPPPPAPAAPPARRRPRPARGTRRVRLVRGEGRGVSI